MASLVLLLLSLALLPSSSAQTGGALATAERCTRLFAEGAEKMVTIDHARLEDEGGRDFTAFDISFPEDVEDMFECKVRSVYNSNNINNILVPYVTIYTRVIDHLQKNQHLLTFTLRSRRAIATSMLVSTVTSTF